MDRPRPARDVYLPESADQIRSHPSPWTAVVCTHWPRTGSPRRVGVSTNGLRVHVTRAWYTRREQNGKAAISLPP